MTEVMTSVESLFAPVGLPPEFPGFPDYSQAPFPSTPVLTAGLFVPRQLHHRASIDKNWKPPTWSPSPSKLKPSQTKTRPALSPLNTSKPLPEPLPFSVSPDNVESTLSSESVSMKVYLESPKVGQYDYKDFSEVERWILHFTKVYGPALGVAFEAFCMSRSRYLEEKKSEWAQGMENLIKNDVGVRRLQEDHPEYFDDSNKGRGLTFYQGRFLGWDEEVGYNPTLKAVVVYEI